MCGMACDKPWITVGPSRGDAESESTSALHGLTEPSVVAHVISAGKIGRIGIIGVWRPLSVISAHDRRVQFARS